MWCNQIKSSGTFIQRILINNTMLSAQSDFLTNSSGHNVNIMDNGQILWLSVVLLLGTVYAAGPTLIHHFVNVCIKLCKLFLWRRSGFVSRSRRFERNKNVSWPRGSVLGLRPQDFEFRILCLEDSVILLMSPSSGGSPGPIQPVCAHKWPKARFISFIHYFCECTKMWAFRIGILCQIVAKPHTKCNSISNCCFLLIYNYVL